MSVLGVMLWGVAPYLMLLLLVGGLIWRRRYDRFGWTTRSSQLYESRLLRVGSPLFHIGILVVIVGHVIGLVIPESWTSALGMSNAQYHVLALALGIPAGVCTLGGIALLIWRRRSSGPVFSATTVNDKAMYVVLVLAIATGLATTLVAAGAAFGGASETNYRETVSPWFRSLFVLRPDIDSMGAASLNYQIHTLIGMALIAIMPFTRLVHAFAAPWQYLFRPYVVYRSRAPRDYPRTAAEPRGWDPVSRRQ
ncbi:respiratory nitrate reductase subunit gamma [Spiractinospora alimapuensis]|uniref:respiratory nitrate reductase subunit gamma n=1 Tax=Spiractinospora alimapuensis TaxID=2820884 RepID=UPI001F20CF86|nr:respiratory nitrate reductase subunit gamma [Spiractinospora alimapuensis]QVQ50114.1 respiratory nitrate reductase subunit gamma [Spiractinospora alimapuensis]